MVRASRVDEDPAHLGETLVLAALARRRRAAIEAVLPTVACHADRDELVRQFRREPDFYQQNARCLVRRGRLSKYARLRRPRREGERADDCGLRHHRRPRFHDRKVFLLSFHRLALHGDRLGNALVPALSPRNLPPPRRMEGWTRPKLAQLGERNVWSVLFAFSIVASVVMGGFVVAEKFSGGGDKGVIATVVPGMDKVQESLFRVEKKLDAVQADTTAIRTDTSKIAASVDEIAKRFDSLNSTGGIITNAKTPEEHYHNARVHELGGNFAAARNEYSQYLTSNLDVIDPWQSYAAMLKAQEGRAGAIETMRYFGDKLQPRTVSYQTALAQLEEGDARLTKLQALSSDHPDYGPLSWLISQEFSEARRGDQTLADQRTEKEWLAKFREAQRGGKVREIFPR